MHDLWRYVALMFFWISENVAKWNINLITKHKKNNKKIEKFTYWDSNLDPWKRSTATQRTTSWATTPAGGVAAKSRNESTYIHVFTYLVLVRQPAVCMDTAFLNTVLLCVSIYLVHFLRDVFSQLCTSKPLYRAPRYRPTRRHLELLISWADFWGPCQIK